MTSLFHARLVLFAHAGGATNAFDGWSAALPENIEVWLVQLPGRGKRGSEPAYSDVSSLCADLHAALREHGLLSAPLAFFGFVIWLNLRAAKALQRQAEELEQA